MNMRYGKYYNQIRKEEILKVRCTGVYTNGFSYEFIDENYDTTSEEFVVVYSDCAFTYEEIHKPVQPRDQSKDAFTVAFKMATCEIVQGDWCGFDTSMARHLEFEHGVFSEFWKLPRGDEEEWVSKHEMHSSPIRDMSNDSWFEHMDVCDRVITYLRKNKEFLSEIPTK